MTSQELIDLIRSSTDHKPRSYSGRAMFGKRCVGFSCRSLGDMAEAASAMGVNFKRLGARTDSLGLGVIVYFPRFEWPEDPSRAVTQLVESVSAAIAAYDATGDHKHQGGPYPGDCLRCALRPFESAVRGARPSASGEA